MGHRLGLIQLWLCLYAYLGPRRCVYLVQTLSSLRRPPDHLVLPGASYGQPEPSGTPLSSRPGLLCPWGSQPELHPGPHSPHGCLCRHSLSPLPWGPRCLILCAGGSSSCRGPCLELSASLAKSAPSLPTDLTLRSAPRRFPECTPLSVPCAPHPALFIPLALASDLIWLYVLFIAQFPSILHQQVGSEGRGLVRSLPYL